MCELLPKSEATFRLVWFATSPVRGLFRMTDGASFRSLRSALLGAESIFLCSYGVVSTSRSRDGWLFLHPVFWRRPPLREVNEDLKVIGEKSGVNRVYVGVPRGASSLRRLAMRLNFYWTPCTVDVSYPGFTLTAEVWDRGV